MARWTPSVIPGAQCHAFKGCGHAALNIAPAEVTVVRWSFVFTAWPA